MSFFGHGKRNELPGHVESKINRFLDKVGDSGPQWYQTFGIGSKKEIDVLDKLLSWGDRTWADRNNLSSLLSEAKANAKKLETELATAHSNIRQLEDENQRMRVQHIGELNNLKTTHTSVIKREQDVHGKEVRKLVSELLVNQDDNIGWTDEKLKFKFRKLQTSISSLVSPRNHVEFRIQSDHQVSQDLDPTGFLDRATRSKAHFLLQSRIWTILYDGYFSAPFGFGILGRGGPQQRLFDMFLSWAKLLGKVSDSDASSTQVYELFNQGQLVNTWRATTFQCINESFTTPGDTQAGTTSIAALLMENTNQTILRITKILTQTSRVSGSSPPTLLNDEVRQIVLESQDLAMQFGLHAARLQLLMPGPGDEVRIGADIHDCEDGDYDRGARHVVDLVTLPGLQVIGDGRSDYALKRTLVACEIYPRQ